nr:hypothetical protein [candidate division Zixibacteria bacterium]
MPQAETGCVIQSAQEDIDFRLGSIAVSIFLNMEENKNIIFAERNQNKRIPIFCFKRPGGYYYENYPIIVYMFYYDWMCAHINDESNTRRKNCLEMAKRCPLEFSMPIEESENAWGRAQSFIGRFSSIKLQTATDYVIQTYNPISGDTDFGYYVIKTPYNGEVQFSVECVSGNIFGESDAKTNAHLLAYYMKTGILCNPKMVAQ